MASLNEIYIIESRYKNYFELKLQDFPDDISFLSILIDFLKGFDCVFHAAGMKNEILKISKTLHRENTRIIVPKHRPFLFVEIDAVVSRMRTSKECKATLSLWNGFITEIRELLFYNPLYENRFCETEKQLLHKFTYVNHIDHIDFAILNEPDSSCSSTYICIIKKDLLLQINNYFQDNGYKYRLASAVVLP